MVLAADCGLLSVNNLEELAKLQTTLANQGRAVSIEYILAVPAARYGDFADALRASASTQPVDRPWVSETTWTSSSKTSTVQRRLVISSSPRPGGGPATHTSAQQDDHGTGGAW